MKTIDYVEQEILRIRAEGLYRERRGVMGGVNLASNDYMNLRHHKEVVRASIDAINLYGTTAGGSPVVNGYLGIHEEFEAELSDWYGGKEVLLWASGFGLNHALLKYLPQEGDTVIADRLMHHSALKGAMEGKGVLKRFHHNDLLDMERLLQKAKGNVFVVLESVYSMDGDSPDLQKVKELKAQYGFTWILDEAHAVGWYGRGLAPKGVDILVGTLGKALVSMGGYAVFEESILKKFMVNVAKEFMYTTYPSPGNIGAALAAVRMIREGMSGDWINEAKEIRKLLGEYFEMGGVDSAIIPCITGSNEDTTRIGRQLREQGIEVGVIRPPSVPAGKGRLRISINKDHTAEYFKEMVEPVLEEILCV